MSRYGASPIDELFAILQQDAKQQSDGEPKKKARKPEEIQWRTMVFHGDTLILDHAQNDFNKVLRFTISSLVELASQGVQDYRITMQDQKGNLYFFAIGEKTQVVNYKKAEEMK